MGLFDVIYLGIFIILSPAFDGRFYQTAGPSTAPMNELANAVKYFHSIINIVSNRFTILLDGEVIAPSYIVNRMLGEFAAAAVVLAQSIDYTHFGVVETGPRYEFKEDNECILHECYPEVSVYYSHCMKQGHKYFLWTGPEIEILPNSPSLLAVLSDTTYGTLFDLPGHSIYKPATIPSAVAPPTSATTAPLASEPSTSTPLAETLVTESLQSESGVEGKRKRRARGNSNGGGAIKRVKQ
jgi:hypothetical protein